MPSVTDDNCRYGIVDNGYSAVLYQVHVTERRLSPAEVGMVDEAGERKALHQEGDCQGNEQQSIALDEQVKPHLGDCLGQLLWGCGGIQVTCA